MSFRKPTRSPDKFRELSQACAHLTGPFSSQGSNLCHWIFQGWMLVDFWGGLQPRIKASWSYEMRRKCIEIAMKTEIRSRSGESGSMAATFIQMQQRLFSRVSLTCVSMGGASGKGKHLHRKSWNCQTDNTSEQRGPAFAASSLFISFISGCLQNLLEKSNYARGRIENTKYWVAQSASHFTTCCDVQHPCFHFADSHNLNSKASLWCARRAAAMFDTQQCNCGWHDTRWPMDENSKHSHLEPVERERALTLSNASSTKVWGTNGK